jgi:glycosyltransferase involved in cell wall biosynthesis
LHGWLKPYKGLHFLLESWRELNIETGKARLLIVGGGEKKLVREVQDQIAVSGLADTVSVVAEFVHPTAELPYYLQAADVNVLPYQEITTSAALMTVIPYAKPIIATDLPFFRELLGDAASLVPYGDCQRLAQEIRGLALNPAERDRLSLRIAQRFGKRKFSWEQIARQTAECYRHALVEDDRDWRRTIRLSEEVGPVVRPTLQIPLSDGPRRSRR